MRLLISFCVQLTCDLSVFMPFFFILSFSSFLCGSLIEFYQRLGFGSFLIKKFRLQKNLVLVATVLKQPLALPKFCATFSA